MPELVGFQTMVILESRSQWYGLCAVCVFGLDFQLFKKSGSSYCVMSVVYFAEPDQTSLWAVRVE